MLLWTLRRGLGRDGIPGSHGWEGRSMVSTDPAAVAWAGRGQGTVANSERQPVKRGSQHSVWKTDSRKAPSKTVQSLPHFACSLPGAVCRWLGPNCSRFWQGFMKPIFQNLYFFHEEKKNKTQLTIMREEKCACLQTCGLQIASNSHITGCHLNTSAWQYQNSCHPFYLILIYTKWCSSCSISSNSFLLLHCSFFLITSKLLLSAMSSFAVTCSTFIHLINALFSFQVYVLCGHTS